jgi:ubiquinone/menaquinone biosynthesis C-methylase UbiE
MSAEMVAYFSRRATEYESIYFRPDPQRLFEQEEIARFIRAGVAGRRVLEVAAGTGFWTVHAAATAELVTATDASADTLQIASAKSLTTVSFMVADAFDLTSVPGSFDAALSCCWISHVPRSRLKEFLDGLHSRLETRSTVLLVDNVYVPGIGGEQIREGEDTYKIR